MATLMWTVFGISLAGSLHCAGMCGALVAFAVAAPDREGRTRPSALLHVLYHGGRMIVYPLIGAACGFAGAALDVGGSMIGFQRVAAIAAGGLMVIGGVVALLQQANVRMIHFKGPAVLQNWVMKAQRGAAALNPVPRALTIGFLTGFLPCGWLYMFALTAAGTGDPWWGAAVMGAFWAGTVPILLTVGVGSQWLVTWFGKRVPMVMSIAIIVLGLYTISGRLSVPASKFDQLKPVELNSSAEAVEHLKTVGDQVPPCCQHDAE
jgi:sulfite exporter TauE/SafE